MLCILCDKKGTIVSLSKRAETLGFLKGDLLPKCLTDALSRRAWLQILAEIANTKYLDDSKLDSPNMENEKCGQDPSKILRNILLALSDKASLGLFPASGPDNTDTSQSSSLLLDGRNFSIGLKKGRYLISTEAQVVYSEYVFLLGTVSNLRYTESSLSEQVDQRFLYDMSWIDENENAVIASDKIGRVIYANSAVESYFGYSPSEMIGKCANDLLSAEHAKGTKIMEKLVQGEPWAGPFQILNKDGKILDAFVTDYPIFDRNNKIIGIVGVTSKIKKADPDYRPLNGLLQESRLLTQKELYCSSFITEERVLNGKMTEIVVWHSPNFNRLISAIVVGSPMPDVSGHSHIKWSMENNRNMYVIIDSFQGSSIYCHSEKSIKALEVTVQEATEKATNNAYKLDFVTTVSHEMRTPLNGILGEVENIKSLTKLRNNEISKDLYNQLTDSFDIIYSSGMLQLTLVNNILEWQQLENGNPNVLISKVSLMKTVKKPICCHRWLVHQKNIKVEVHISKGTPMQIFTDETKLNQILLNLLNNACKFTDPNTTINIYVSYDPEKEELKMEVVDCGPGICQIEVPKLFTKFSPLADGYGEKRVGGTGLGLYVCAQLVRALKGRIWYEPKYPKGSKFLFTIKSKEHDPSDKDIVITDSQNKCNSPSEALQQSDYFHVEQKLPKNNDKRIPGEIKSELLPILLVEDNSINLKVLQKMLKIIGLDDSEVQSAEDGSICLDKCSKTEFGLILMDISIPVLDGVEATRRLRERGCKSRIVGVTANGRFDEELALKSGMDSVFVKPITKEYLQKILFKSTN